MKPRCQQFQGMNCGVVSCSRKGNVTFPKQTPLSISALSNRFNRGAASRRLLLRNLWGCMAGVELCPFHCRGAAGPWLPDTCDDSSGRRCRAAAPPRRASHSFSHTSSARECFSRRVSVSSLCPSTCASSAAVRNRLAPQPTSSGSQDLMPILAPAISHGSLMLPSGEDQLTLKRHTSPTAGLAEESSPGRAAEESASRISRTPTSPA